MRTLLLFLLCAPAWAASVSVPVTVNDEQCTSWTVTGTTATCTAWGGNQPPPPPPPPPPNCQAMGELIGDGHTQTTVGVVGGTPVYWVLKVPAVLTVAAGTTTSIRLGSTGRGGDHTRTATLSKTPCDFSVPFPATTSGINSHVDISWNGPNVWGSALQINAGSGDWYLSVKQNCTAGSDCNFIYAASLPWQ